MPLGSLSVGEKYTDTGEIYSIWKNMLRIPMILGTPLMLDATHC